VCYKLPFENLALYRSLLPLLQYKETNTLINTILEVQPRASSGGEGKSNDEIVQELVASVQTRVPGNK
jgi:hypothetical protein